MTDDQLIRRAALAGGLATAPWLIACVGWTAHWNAYVNLIFTVGGAHLWFVLIACTLERYKRVRP